MTWLGLQFNTRDMPVTLQADKLLDIMLVVHQLGDRQRANIHDLVTLLGKLFHVAQCCPPAHYFVNRMLATIRQCSLTGYIKLSTEFKKDLYWYQVYLPCTNGIYIIHQDNRTPLKTFVDACTIGCSVICYPEAYPQQPLAEYHAICHLNVLNGLVVLRGWAPHLKGQLIHLYSDSTTSLEIFQTGVGIGAFIQACSMELWLMCAEHDITLSVAHTPEVALTASANPSSPWHTREVFSDKVKQLL